MKKIIASTIGILFFFNGTVIGSASHIVKPGDNLSMIAYENNITLKEIKSYNQSLDNFNLIYPGQNINTTKYESMYVQPKPVNNLKNKEIDKELLAKLIYSEARGESFRGKVAVAEVVLNRIDSKQFPNNLKDVIYQKSQFTKPSSIYTEECMKAVNTALIINRKNDKLKGSLYFYNHTLISDTWLKTREKIIEIGNHTFLK